ncbi:sugar ABC transporter permease [Actinorugispora endophytica]|uniref:Xylose transport system permease protein XylH n=1 Tax=Actinorugispora endophytica TaxID=1605990 RepID=A0A4R6UUL4_9ACTN|nr:sugar ABC transporter permease [Actinorugispora endophytica]TDQ49599.1 D-xylose transport system permease protein [Actinorugispora endophytica]
MAQQTTPAAHGATAARDPRLIVDGGGAKGLLSGSLRRLRGGELGPVPVIAGLVVIAVVFQSLNDKFLSPQNLSNLTLQIVAIGLMSCGVIMVLLLGEIDLSVGSVAGVSGVVMAVLAIRHGWNEIAAMVVAIAVGALIGVIHGAIFAKIGVPAFVVTLAGLIGWQGAQIYLLSPDGTMNVPYDGPIAYLTQTYFVPVIGWTVGGLAVALYAASTLYGERRRAAAGLPAKSVTDVVTRIVLVAVPVLGTVWVLNSYKGVPLAFLIFVGFVVVFDLVLRKTRYGRMVFAVGGSAEAARRAGISVDLIRISVFALASMLSALGGIMFVSRSFAVNQSTGGGDALMMAIAAAVIGGTSLFGGRGSAYSALLGGLVLGAIASGLFLLQMDSSVRFMITAGVLLVAVILDAVSRRSRKTHARG